MRNDWWRDDRVHLLVLLLGATLVFVWGLGASGYANSYYSAAVLAGSESWKAMFFGSLDPANAITVDKPPLGLWPMVLSARAFGFSSWTILVPQAVEGVGSVALLYGCVRWMTGHAAPALLAGVAFALTPVAVVVFRFNNPDALLTLLLVGAAYATIRAVARAERATAWMALAGVLSGLGFLTKMLEAFLVLPALGVTYLVLGPRSPGRRLLDLAVAGAAVVAASGWWVATVQLWPADRRPFVGGSPTNSVLQLALGYNGVGRLTGSGGTSAETHGLAAINLVRIGRTDVGGEVLWLVPAAALLGASAWWRHRGSGDRVLRAGLLLWWGWLVVAGGTFAVMVGIFHSYYTVVLAPAIAALAAVGAWSAWDARDRRGVRRTLSWTLGLTGVGAAGILVVLGDGLRWTSVPILLAAIAVAVALSPRWGPSQIPAAVGVGALVTTLAGPALFSAATVALPHTGSGPMAGPGRGGPPVSDGLPASDAPSRATVALLSQHEESYRWAAAAQGARTASALQLALGEPVLAIGGYKGTDPAPTLAAFQSLVRDRRVHWLVTGGTTGPSADAIAAWASTRFVAVQLEGRTIYDLSIGSRTGALRAPRATEATAYSGRS